MERVQQYVHSFFAKSMETSPSKYCTVRVRVPVQSNKKLCEIRELNGSNIFISNPSTPTEWLTLQQIAKEIGICTHTKDVAELNQNIYFEKKFSK